MNSSRKRVLMIATSKETKGGITAVLKAYEKSSLWEDFQIKWLESHTDGTRFYKLLWAIRSYFLALFLIPRYNIIHIHLSQVPSLLRKVPFFIYAKLLKKKTIIHVHSTITDGPFNWLYRFLFKKANYVIVLSQSMKEWINKILKIEKNVVVIYNPCIAIKERSTNKEKIILFAGVLTEKKGYLDLINAFALATHQYLDWKLVLAGSGDIEEGKILSKKLQIENRVFFPGWVSGTEKDILFSSASIFCLPSYTEGFPTAILEACSYGIPFITTPVGGIPDIVVDGKNGLLFQPGNIEELKEKLLLLISNPKTRLSFGESATELANNVFGLEKISKEIEYLYHTL